MHKHFVKRRPLKYDCDVSHSIAHRNDQSVQTADGQSPIKSFHTDAYNLFRTPNLSVEASSIDRGRT